jgi:hypothetical protein
MYNRTWVIVTVILCVVFTALAFPIFARARGVPTAVAFTLIGLAVIWFAYLARAYVFTRPGFWKGGSREAKEGN